MLVKLYKIDLTLTVVYALTLQTMVYLTNYIVTHTIDREAAGDFFATISLLNILSNIFCFGASYVLAKNIPLFKIKFSHSVWKNVKNMSVFYFTLFFIVLLVAIFLDIVFYRIHLAHYIIWESRYYHPSELFLFTIFIIISNSYFFSLFRAYGKIEVAYICSIIGLLLSMFLFIYSYYFKTYIIFTYGIQENIMLNYIVFQISGFVFSLGLMYIYFLFVFVPDISKGDNIGRVFNGWKSEIKYFFINSVQSDWFILSTLLLELFSLNEADIAVFTYMFGIIGIMYTVNKIMRQMYRNYIAEYIAAQDYLGAKKFIINGLICMSVVMTIIAALLIYYNKNLLNYFGIAKYSHEFILLVLIELYCGEFDSILSSFISLYSKTSLKVFTHYNSIITLIMLIGGGISIVHYQLLGMVWTFIICTFIYTTMEIILFIFCFLEFRTNSFENKRP